MNSDLSASAKSFLELLGIDFTDPNFRETPERFAKTFVNLCRGLGDSAKDEIRQNLSCVFPTRYKGMIIQEPIRAYSLCSHHLLPVTYDVLFGYIPKQKSLGFSKSIKAIEVLAARPVSQEDFTQDIIDTFDEALHPMGIMVVVRGVHACMQIRSVKTGAVNTTSAVRGVFKDEERTRNEFLRLAAFKNGN